MSISYPEREPYFAMKYIRRLTKACVAQSHGHRVFTLLTVIAGTEDARRYRGPVSFFNSQLLSVCGFGKWLTLDSARREAAEAGWLHYVAPPLGKVRPGIYWVTIPPEWVDAADDPIDEGTDDCHGVEPYADGAYDMPLQYTAGAHSFGGACAATAYTTAYAEGEHPNLVPVPNIFCADAQGAQPPSAQRPERTKRPRVKPDGPTTSDLDQWFTCFWAAYPRKVDKGRARKCYPAALKSATTEWACDPQDAAERITAAAAKYSQSRRGEDAKFTKHPGSWLTAMSFLDESTVPAAAPAGQPRRAAWGADFE